jgi:hypothetical protein
VTQWRCPIPRRLLARTMLATWPRTHV